METKHTPGPWLIEESTVYALNERRLPVNRFHASVDAGFDNCDQRISRAEVNANVKLIAAAPDLLAALQKLHASLKSLNDCGDAGHMVEEDVETARAAIALVLE